MNALACSSNILTTGQENLTLLDQLNHAINYATEIEISVAFIQFSGLKCLLPALTEAISRNVSIKILTSDYLCITDPKALRILISLSSKNIAIRIFQTQYISFHMKAYIFVQTKKNKVEGCAFIGSNNISKMALTNGHEWCLRYDYFKDNQNELNCLEFKKIRDSFAKLFSSQQTIELNNEWLSSYILKRKKRLQLSYNIEPEVSIKPNLIQEEALEALRQSRAIGYKKGLVVLATGMGKTWLSAFDVKAMQAKKILFIAHREGILNQALNTFAMIFPERTSGFYLGTKHQLDVDMLFASVFTLGKEKHFTKFHHSTFDYIIIDEFHHAAAYSYQNLLNYYTPRFLLGLTATPERTDQSDILSLCSNNLIFSRNLVYGINNKILAPFHYYGIWDESVDYTNIPWKNGLFDHKSLTAQFATKKRGHHILNTWKKYKQTRTLAFCISKKHADFMANLFNKAGFRAVAVYSCSTINRSESLVQLDKGEIDIIFSIDLFNEGTDIPSLDCILMLRPTESKIVFLQQLGRGLRLSPNKEFLTVIDFIGNHRSFFNKEQFLINNDITLDSNNKKNSKQYSIPDGCYINIEPTLINFWQQLQAKIGKTSIEEFDELYEKLSHRPTITEFYYAGFDLKKVNRQHCSWFKLVGFKCRDNLKLKEKINNYDAFLLNTVQVTRITKSFKMILLKAFIALDGFRISPTLEQLAEKSWYVLSDYPYLKEIELPRKESNMQALDKGWIAYWKKNPIRALTKIHAKHPAYFIIKAECFMFNLTVKEEDVDELSNMLLELIDYRLADYLNRKNIKAEKESYDLGKYNNLVTNKNKIIKAAEPTVKYF